MIGVSTVFLLYTNFFKQVSMNIFLGELYHPCELQILTSMTILQSYRRLLGLRLGST